MTLGGLVKEGLSLQIAQPMFRAKTTTGTFHLLRVTRPSDENIRQHDEIVDKFSDEVLGVPMGELQKKLVDLPFKMGVCAAGKYEQRPSAAMLVGGWQHSQPSKSIMG